MSQTALMLPVRCPGRVWMGRDIGENALVKEQGMGRLSPFFVSGDW